MHWLAPRLVPERCTVKVRHRQREQRAVLDLRADGTARIVFDEPQRAVTPGQYAVVYSGTRCLGGGVIDALLRPPSSAVRATEGEPERPASL